MYIFSNDLDQLVNYLRKSLPRHVHFINSYTCGLMKNNKEYMSIFQEEKSINVIDGKLPFILRKLMSKSSNTFHIRGTDFMRKYLSTDLGGKHFLLGSTPETLAKLIINLRNDYGNCTFDGYSPKFGEISKKEMQEIDRRIRNSGANAVWVGMGTPKQDYISKFITTNIEVSAFSVGAAFDFLAKTKTEAPIIVSKLGLEWLFRLLSEPKRLWRRYILVSPVGLILIMHMIEMNESNDHS